MPEPAPEPNTDTDTSDDTGAPTAEDKDGDGWDYDLDCDDNDPNTFPLHQGTQNTWKVNEIKSTSVICPGIYKRARINVTGTDVVLSGHGVALDGDNYDYTESGYVYPFISIKTSGECGIEGFEFRNFRGKTIAVYAEDVPRVAIIDVQVGNFVQSGVKNFGTIYIRRASEVYISGTTIFGPMGRITLLGCADTTVYETAVAQEPPSYPETLVNPIRAALTVAKDTTNGQVTASGKAVIYNSAITAHVGTAAIHIADGTSGAITSSEVQCALTGIQYGIGLYSANDMLVVQNVIDSCSTGIAGFGTAAGNEIADNTVTNYVDDCINIDAQANIVGSNSCL